MALEKCKECGTQISNKAKACPSCGAPVKRTSLFTKLVAGFIGLAVISGIMGSCSDKQHQEQAAQQEAARIASLTPEQRAAEDKRKAAEALAKAERDEQAAGAYACRTFILKSLKDPDSAQFEYGNYEAPSKRNAKGLYEVQHKVRAKNSFGAYNLSYFNCVLKKTDTDWVLVSVKELK